MTYLNAVRLYQSIMFTILFVACGPSAAVMESATSISSTTVVVDEPVSAKEEKDSLDSEGGIGPSDMLENVADKSTTLAVVPVESIQYQQLVSDSLVEIQVKSPELLRASLDACFGSDSNTTLRSDMFAVQGFLSLNDELEFEGAGRRKFIGALSPYMKNVKTVDNSSAGSSSSVVLEFVGPDVPDVIDLESVNLADPSGTARSATTVDSLSDRYLRSLESVSLVVAHNCDLTRSNCQCDTLDKAKEMIKRCLPLVSMTPDQFASTAKSMSELCSGSSLGSRSVIASMVASYAFALRR